MVEGAISSAVRGLAPSTAFGGPPPRCCATEEESRDSPLVHVRDRDREQLSDHPGRAEARRRDGEVRSLQALADGFRAAAGPRRAGPPLRPADPQDLGGPGPPRLGVLDRKSTRLN